MMDLRNAGGGEEAPMATQTPSAAIKFNIDGIISSSSSVNEKLDLVEEAFPATKRRRISSSTADSNRSLAAEANDGVYVTEDEMNDTQDTLYKDEDLKKEQHVQNPIGGLTSSNPLAAAAAAAAAAAVSGFGQTPNLLTPFMQNTAFGKLFGK